MDSNVELNFTSTLDGPVLILSCENEMSNINTTDEQILSVICHSNGSWVPDPAEFIESSFTTASPGTKQNFLILQIVFTNCHILEIYYIRTCTIGIIIIN